MSRAKRAIGGAVLLGAALVLALAHRAHEPQPAALQSPAEAPAETAPRGEATPPPVAEPAPAPVPAPPAVPPPVAAAEPVMTPEQKHGLAGDAEAARIAAREKKLAALDWNAPRPGPPPADARVPVSKKESELTVEEKLEKTDRIASQLEERIRRTQEAVDAAAKSGQDSGAQVMLLARLQSKVSELEQRAQALRGERTEGEPPAGGQAPVVSPEVTQ